MRRTQQQRLKRGDVAKVTVALAEPLEAEATPDEEAPVRPGHRYLNHRLDCLDYPGALALGLPIGSGMIESGHRHVLPARLKKAAPPGYPTTPTNSPTCASCAPMTHGPLSGINLTHF